MQLPNCPATLRSRVELELMTQRDPVARHLALQRAAEDPEWFIDFFCYTFDPRATSGDSDLPFFLYPYQRDLIHWMQSRQAGPNDGLIEKSRDMGVTYTILAFILHQWLFAEGFQVLLGSRNEKEVDNFEETSLFGKVEYMLSKLPGWLSPKGYNVKKHRRELRLTNPANKNLISGESSNPQFSRGKRFSMIFFDEGAFWDDFESAWRAAGQATKCRIVVSTPNGKNSFFRLRDSGKIDILRLHWSMHPNKDQAWYEGEKSRMTEVDIAQELDISYDRSVSGVVYPTWGDLPRGAYPYMPSWPLFVAIDFGFADATAMVWAQRNPVTGRVRLLESYENNNKPADFYIPLITGEIPGNWHYRYAPKEMEIISRHSTWGQPVVYGDPAARQRSQLTGSSIVSEYRKYGLSLITKPEAQAFRERISRSHIMLRNCEVNIVETQAGDDEFDIYDCKTLDAAIYNARYRVNTTNDAPEHDWTSHFRSALEYLAVNLPLLRERRQRPSPIRVKMAYDSL